MNEKVFCDHCGKEIGEDDERYTTHDDLLICETCMNDSFISCDRCGEIFRLDDVTSVEDDSLCDDCRDDQCVQCYDCADWFYRTNTYWAEGERVCENCFQNSYTDCDECGDTIHVDNAIHDGGYTYCSGCFADIPRGLVHDYSYSPSPIFHPRGDTMGYGFELETGSKENESLDTDDLSGALHAISKDENLFYLKEDGSIDGIEIVSHPGTLEYWLNNSVISDITKVCRKNNAYSHDAECSCGFHIHASKSLFGDNPTERDLTYLKSVTIIGRTWFDLILPVSRRKLKDLEGWACNYNDLDNPMSIREIKRRNGHYRSINETSQTFELRIFRGTLKNESIYAALEFYDSLIRFCRISPVEIVMNISMPDLCMELCRGTKYLKEYMHSRGIVVSEESDILSDLTDIYHEMATNGYATNVPEVFMGYETVDIDEIEEICEVE